MQGLFMCDMPLPNGKSTAANRGSAKDGLCRFGGAPVVLLCSG